MAKRAYITGDAEVNQVKARISLFLAGLIVKCFLLPKKSWCKN
jgi:hypothetical protein